MWFPYFIIHVVHSLYIILAENNMESDDEANGSKEGWCRNLFETGLDGNVLPVKGSKKRKLHRRYSEMGNYHLLLLYFLFFANKQNNHRVFRKIVPRCMAPVEEPYLQLSQFLLICKG